MSLPLYPMFREPTEGQRLLARWMTEEALEAHVAQLVGALGGLFYHTRDSRRSPAGWPDVALWVPQRPDVLIASELKRDGYHRPKWSDDQQAWRGALEGVTRFEYYAWEPVHWLTGTIVAALTKELSPGLRAGDRP